MAKYESKDTRAVRVVFEGNPNYVKLSHTPDGRVVVQASLGENLVDSVEVQADERPKAKREPKAKKTDAAVSEEPEESA